MATYGFGHFRLNVATRQLFRDSEPIPLTAKAFDTLVVLVTHHGHVVTKDALMKAVWHDAIVSDDSLTQNIRALRRALGDDAGEPVYITTIARRGYRFIQPVHEIAEDGGEAAPVPRPEQAAPSPAVRAVSPGARRWPLVLAGVLTGALATFVMSTGAWRPAAATPGEVLRFSVSAPPGTTLESGGAVSPDARMIAFSAADAQSGRSNLWITDFTSGESQLLPGTEDAARPAWSPDGTALAFFARGSLRTVDRSTGVVRAVAPVRNPGGASWTGRQILFADLRSPISTVPAGGGEVVPVTTLDAGRQEVAHRWPSALPDGRRFLYFVESADPAHAGTYVGEFDGALKQRIFELPAVYQDGHLVYVREGVLYAQRIDLGTYSLGGAPVALGADAAPLEITTSATFSAAPRLLAYSGSNSTQRLTWFDRSGTVVEHIDGPPGLYNPFLLRDGSTLLAATGTGGGPRAIWTIDLERGAPMRLTVGMRPLASPDGAEVAFTDDRATGVADVYVRRTAGADAARLLLRTPENKMVDDWSPDGTWLLVSAAARTTKTDLWMVPAAGGTPRPMVQTPANELHGRISPDGRWVTYASDETGELQVYIQSLDEPGLRQPVSVTGGTEPRWRGDGRELFYLGADLSVMSVDIAAGETLQLGQPRKLFRVPMARARSLYINHYDVAADGRRFVIQSAEQQAAPPLMVLLNWTALLPE